jgi:tRNA pseudouridine38-40 synthase
VREVEPVSSDFHARFMAIRRQYLYRILNRQTPSALYKNHVWHIHYPLALDAMESAANLLIGKHDFSSFRHPGCYAASPVKTLEKIAISKNEEEIHLRFSAPSFLYHMVRNLVGTLVYVGREKYPPEYIDTILQAKSRSAAGPTAPAHGLYFQAVEYKNA